MKKCFLFLFILTIFNINAMKQQLPRAPQGNNPVAPALSQEHVQIIEQIRARQHQCWKLMFRLSRNIHATYSDNLRNYTKSLAKILGWAGTYWGIHRSVSWYRKGKSSIGRTLIAGAGIISSFIGSHLASLFIHPTIPLVRAIFNSRNEIQEIKLQEEQNIRQFALLLGQDHIDPPQLMVDILDETKDAAFAEEDQDYQRTSFWGTFTMRNQHHLQRQQWPAVIPVRQ